MKKSTITILVLFANALMTVVCAQSSVNVLRSQISSIEKSFMEGYLPTTHEIKLDTARTGATESYNLTLERGYDYRIVAVCDADCGDIDLELFDEDGELVDNDLTDDDYPIVSVNCSWTQKYELNLKMVNCEIEPCRFAIAVYRKAN